MKLFKGDAIKRVNKLMDNAVNRKEKMVKKLDEMKGDYEALYQAEQDDFNRAILEDGETDKKLVSDRKALGMEIKDLEFRLGQIDEVVNAELKKAITEVDKERNQFVKDKGEDFRKQFDKMNEAKIKYLEMVIDYSKMKSEYNREYWETFREVENRVGLRNRDPRDDFDIHLSQRFQSERNYNPMVYNDELNEALYGKLHGITANNRDKYKN